MVRHVHGTTARRWKGISDMKWMREGEGTYNVRRDRPVYVPEADDHGERDAALVRALDVVRHPCDDVRDAGVDAARREVDRDVR